MRLFIAIDLPKEITSELHKLQKMIVIDGKITKTSSFHLTLNFLGEINGSKLPLIKEALNGIQFSAFDACLSGVGAFPNTRNARIIWAGVEPRVAFLELQKKVDSVLQDLGFEPDNRFHPHITLARIKFARNKKDVADMIGGLEVSELGFKVDSFMLIKSVLSPQGPEYEVLETVVSSQ